jgi:hypothetical protein
VVTTVADAEEIAVEILAERDRQDRRWGKPKDLPDGTGPRTYPLADLAWAGHDSTVPRTMGGTTADELATAAKASCDIATKQGNVTYADIFIEEAAEALAESDQENLRAELIQVAAVAVKWVQVIDLRKAGAL